ncbi:hypothetical protein RIF29_05487 [Crotalaria pallida]|uniref:Uncharacterized protein n=1 Tax=Crotalaria pallida TaxID=3830 RepID=A0AAN9PAN3_CROPI
MAQSSHCSISISQGHKAFSSQPFEVSNSLLSSDLTLLLPPPGLLSFPNSLLRLSLSVPISSRRLSLAISPSPVAVLARHLSPLFGEFDFTNIWGLLHELISSYQLSHFITKVGHGRLTKFYFITNSNCGTWQIEHIPDKQPHDLHHQPTVIDPKHANQIVRLDQFSTNTAISDLEMYKQAGSQFRDELQRHNLPSYLVKDINARLEGIQPKVRSSDVIGIFGFGILYLASLLGQFHKFSMRNYWNSNFDYLMGSQKLLQLVSDSSKASNTSNKKEIKDNKDSKSESHCSNEPHWPSGILNNG